MGFGLQNLNKIPCDYKGRIIAPEFKKLIEKAKAENKIPLVLNCTIGTTVFGTIDPIDELSDICKDNDIYLHLDACYGGALIFLQEYKNNILKGIEKADSIVIDMHKVFPITLQCSFFLTKHENAPFKCNSLKADYLFMKDKIIYDSCLDTGDSSVQCGRHVDILKLWLYIKGNGLLRIQNEIKQAIQNAKYLASLLKNHPNFILIDEPDFLNVSFYYLSDSLLKKFNVDTKQFFFDLDKDKNIDWEEVAKLAPIIKAKMMKEGTMMIAYQRQNQKYINLKNFFRAVITINKQKKDMDFILNEIHKIGKDL